MIRRPPRSTPLYSSAASDVYKRQAEHVRGIVLEPGGVLWHARADGDVTRVLRAHVHVELGVHRIHGVRSRLDEVDVAEALADEVAHRAIETGHDLVVVAVVDRVERDSVLERSHQGEGLERGACLRDVLGDGIALNLPVSYTHLTLPTN